MSRRKIDGQEFRGWYKSVGRWGLAALLLEQLKWVKHDLLAPLAQERLPDGPGEDPTFYWASHGDQEFLMFNGNLDITIARISNEQGKPVRYWVGSGGRGPRADSVAQARRKVHQTLSKQGWREDTLP